jgi:outer membrane protein insertion porin family
MQVALLLVLALAPRAGDTAADELVRAVRIEADHPGQLQPFISLAPGRPLDPEAVRRAVELIYATGRFEDVRVEALHEPGEEGVTIVFHPLPAPLFAGVRVEGDRVLSAGSLTRIARLRPGEPLWPSRLERAARDIALALVRRGHLEALVEPRAVRVPGGALAEFRIRAGPRVRVGGVRVEGASGAPSLDDLVRPLPGEIYRKQRADAAREAMRHRLVDSGFWAAEVELDETYDPTRGRMSLVFRAVPGARMSLEVRGANLPAGLVSAVRDLVREGGASSDALEVGADRIESYLRSRGHREARASVAVEPREQGQAVVYDVEPGPRAEVASVEIRGAPADLLVGLRTQPGRPIEEAALEDDAARLRARLQDEGHFEARIEPDVPEGGGQLPVVFLVQAGPRAIVKSVEVVGPPRPTAGRDEGPQELALRPGLPYRLADLARSRETLLDAWRRAGYLDVQVRPEVDLPKQGEAARDAELTEEATVRLVVEPGPRTIVEHVVLAGLRETKPVTVEREMALRPAEPFSFERLLESQRRLSGLGIFERVSITELNPERQRQRDVVVTVQEAPRTSVSYGVGYSEQDRLRGSIELTRRNLSGLGRTASAFVRGSFRGSRALLNLREPWLFGRKLDSFFTAFWEEEERTGYNYNRKGGIVQTGRAFDPRLSLILRYVYQDTHVYNISIPPEEIDRQYQNSYTVSGPSASIVFDTRDDPLDPHRGLFLGADAQLSLAALGGTSYLRSFFQATSVRRLRADLVLVVSGRLGLAATFGDADPLLPLPERFFAGGDFGPRGFPIDGVGPKVVGSNGQLYPDGGNALLLGDVEARYSLTRSFQLASFLDTGNVYPEVRDLSIRNLRWSAGLGARYRTPIGPIRLDWGYVLDPRPSDQGRSHFHLTIGYAF